MAGAKCCKKFTQPGCVLLLLINAAIFLQVSSHAAFLRFDARPGHMRRQLQLSGFFQRRQGLSARIGSFRTHPCPLLISPFTNAPIQRIRIHNRTARHIDQHCALSFLKRRPHSSGETSLSLRGQCRDKKTSDCANRVSQSTSFIVPAVAVS